MHVITGISADVVWRHAAALLLDPNVSNAQVGRGGETAECLHVTLEVTDPSQRWVVSRMPPMNPAFALVEVMWIVGGRDDAKLVNYWNPVLPKYSGLVDRYHGAYGFRLRHHLGVDQLQRVYRALESSPDTRQCVLQFWDGSIDLPREDGTPAAADIPCNVIALPKIRRGRLEWLQVIRSNDLFLGVPHNIVQFTSLQEILSGWLGVLPGAYVQLSDSLHMYARDTDAVKASLEPVAIPRNSDSLAIDRHAWEKVITRVLTRLDLLTQDSLTPSEFSSITFGRDLPAAYENVIVIAAADCARRRGWNDLIDECVRHCTNPALVCMWSRWYERQASRTAGTH